MVEVLGFTEQITVSMNRIHVHFDGKTILFPLEKNSIFKVKTTTF